MRSLSKAPWIVQAGLEGRLFTAFMGQVTTPITTAATTAITAQRPMAWLRVPNGTMIIPVSVRVVIESTGITTQGEVAYASTTNDVGNGTSSAATNGPTNKNPASTNTSNVVARQLATANVTAETGYLEHQRMSFAASSVNAPNSWPFIGVAEEFPILRGPASWLIYVGGNAVNFYAQFAWVEYNEAAAG